MERPSAGADIRHELIVHLRRIVGQRDRTSLNRALVLAARGLLAARRVVLLRVVQHKGAEFVIPCAGMVGDMEDVQDAYLISPQRGHPLAGHPDYAHACRTATPCHGRGDGTHRHVFPLMRHDQPYAVLELERATPLDLTEQELIDQLLGLFLDHLTLIDYAETDTLTGLLNRKTFDENLSRILASAGNDDSAVSAHNHHPLRRHARQDGVSNWLAIADIDHFKAVNDTHGHIIGDEVLLLVAQLMRSSFRFDDQLFRFGGEEFITVLQPARQDDALAVLERFRSSIENHVLPIVGRIGISIGFTRIDPMDTPTELVGRADQALYLAKGRGRNRVESYEDLLADGTIVNTVASKPGAELF